VFSEIARILLLGDPALRTIARNVDSFDEPSFTKDRQSLYATLLDFRGQHKFGRAISAPQIGCRSRLIAVSLAGECQFIVNPEITWTSRERFTMWDDCMSFPSLLVRLERYRSISIHFQDETGKHKDWENMDVSTSELLQHEVDHLNGILAIDRAIDRDSIVMRTTYLAMPNYFRRFVDYEIGGFSE